MANESYNDVAAAPAAYPSWTAAKKEAWLWTNVIKEEGYDPVTRPELSMAKPWTMLRIAGRPNVLRRTLERSADQMEAGRPKIIHTQGAVAAIIYEPLAASEFSGVLAPPPVGGARGVVRMSLAVPPKGKRAITPGIGLKLFVDGGPSLDLLAMNHTVGQGRDFNLFSHTFTHDLRDAHNELRPPQKLMKRMFARVSNEPRWLTIDHLAAVTQTGEAVAVPKVPERLVFRPHPDVAQVFRGRQGEDYRDTLARIPVDAVLYTVEAVGAGPNDGPLQIGVLRLTRTFVSSAGGDRLFFRHMVDPRTVIKS